LVQWSQRDGESRETARGEQIPVDCEGILGRGDADGSEKIRRKEGKCFRQWDPHM
jgi:hypothetical protein